MIRKGDALRLRFALVWDRLGPRLRGDDEAEGRPPVLRLAEMFRLPRATVRLGWRNC